MKSTKARISIAIAIFFLSSVSKTQTLSLFEELDEDGTDSPRSIRGRTTDDGSVIGFSEGFTLLGTSRIGDRYSVMIRDGEGKTLSLTKPLGSDLALPGHPGYALVGVEAASISIRYPESVSCVDSEEKGIRCNDMRTAVLSLTNREPLINSSLSDANSSRDENSSSLNQTQEDEPIVNPFEAISRRGRNSGIQENAQFRPRRINPEDVPPGMRVVSTPFGDRLVED